ncbi:MULTISPECIES: TetR/AcrR family transcriptional regulator [unclassified Meiothermus]|uniref:TetR/AcrR family transcriptional regulator n=1 Tax=unclassified Meiothermus TaxID=370471 RepID=UPI000D7BD96B|nr:MULTISPECIES: TetR/AcrR family transcriptional regulator [unclassified Meiothermus]PZA08962.1 TetR/AcrR family transcriptional regulator [Meiothermus sp. Pnk-1]RYM28644.1 TetR/AcrR family transcriptional regulator [Meiothermus sp. PNK-Is4]
MPRVSEEHRIERKDQILQAAARCFAREGFHATSMAEVIAESGLSAGSVYRYYKSKDELIAAIVERYMSSRIADFMQINQSSADLAEAVASAIQSLSARIDDHGDPFSRMLPQILSEVVRNPRAREQAQRAYGALLDFFAEVVRRAQATGNMRADLDPVGVSRVMLSLGQGFILLKMILQEQVQPELYAETVRRLFSSST